MFTSPLNRFVSSDEDMQDDMAPTGDNMSSNPRPSKKPGKGAGAKGSPKVRNERYSAEAHNGPDGKPTEPIHFDGGKAPQAHDSGRHGAPVASGQKSMHENMRTNSGFGQKGGKFSDGGAESYENMRTNSKGSKSRVSTKA
jgi:hypothetical protein